MIELLKKKINKLLSTAYPEAKLPVNEPKNYTDGDIAVPLFQLSKVKGRDISLCYEDVKALILKEMPEYIENITLINGFLHAAFIKKSVVKDVIGRINEKREEFGKSDSGRGKTVVIDYSSPNIAKPFSIGHLRSTIIGHALGNIFEIVGYKVVRINHLGDWGTQFGKLIVAYKKWGDKEKIKNDPINELVKLYVRYNELAENDEQLLEEGRRAFKKLEENDEEYLALWKWFRDESLKEFMKMYKLLDVHFDSYSGEAFYNDKMEKVTAELEKKKLLKLNEGACIVELDNLPPALIKKSDGTSLYITRDLAAIMYRYNTYHFDMALYVVGNEQALHFSQLDAVTKKMGYNFNIKHVNFGLVMLNGKKMSTRKGKIVKLIDVLHEATELVKQYILEKNPQLENKDETAQKVGIGAVIFNDLKNYRTNDIEFNLEQMLKFEGFTGPYIHYTSVRIQSLLRENQPDFGNTINYDILCESKYFEIIRQIDRYHTVLDKVTAECEVSYLAKYMLNLAQLFNKFYSEERILVSDETEKNTKLVISFCVKTVLDESMKLLGMKVIDKM